MACSGEQPCRVGKTGLTMFYPGTSADRRRAWGGIPYRRLYLACSGVNKVAVVSLTSQDARR